MSHSDGVNSVAESNLFKGAGTQELTTTRLLRDCRELLKLVETQTEAIKSLQARVESLEKKG